MHYNIPLAIAVTLLVALGGCATHSGEDALPTLRYVGSSTIVNFILEAEPIYGRARFVVDTDSESAGGESAILAGRADLAGVATNPREETLKAGVRATMIGQDAIAVVVNRSNAIDDLSASQLKRIFTGKALNWREFGGPDLAIRPFIVGPASATRRVFRSAILADESYAGCKVVRPDIEILSAVESDQGGIGQISLSFLASCDGVKLLTIAGERADPENADYPIARPLYLLWWTGRDRVADFITWTTSEDAEAVLSKRFLQPRDGKS